MSTTIFDPVWYAKRYGFDARTDPSLLYRQYLQTGKAQGHFCCYEAEAAHFAAETLRKARRDLTDIPSVRRRIADFSRRQEAFLRANTIRTVFFSAVSGQYDSLKIPTVLDPTCSYVLFSDTVQPATGVWTVRGMPFWNRDVTRQTRYVKLHPHMLFPDCDLAIWIDQNVFLYSDLRAERASFLAGGAAIATFFHPTRSGVADEAKACLLLKKDSPESIEAQLARYAGEGLPACDLPCTNVVFYNLRHPSLARALCTWWEELETYSRRDQISFTYAMAKNGLTWEPLAPPGVSAANHAAFGVCRHDKNQGIYASIAASVRTGCADPFCGPSFFEQRDAILSAEPLPPVLLVVFFEHDLAYDGEFLHFLLATRSKGAQLLLVDDGSEQERSPRLAAFARTHPGVRHVLLPPDGTEASSSPCSLVLRENAEYVLFLRGATLSGSDWMEKMVLALRETPGAGLVAPVSNRTPSCERLPLGVSLSDINRFVEMWSPAGPYPRVPLLNDFCVGCSKAAAEALASRPGSPFAEDTPFWASAAGFDSVLSIHTYVYTHVHERRHSDRQRDVMPAVWNERLKRAQKTMCYHPILLDVRKRYQALCSSAQDLLESSEPCHSTP